MKKKLVIGLLLLAVVGGVAYFMSSLDGEGLQGRMAFRGKSSSQGISRGGGVKTPSINCTKEVSAEFAAIQIEFVKQTSTLDIEKYDSAKSLVGEYGMLMKSKNSDLKTCDLTSFVGKQYELMDSTLNKIKAKADEVAAADKAAELAAVTPVVNMFKPTLQPAAVYANQDVRLFEFAYNTSYSKKNVSSLYLTVVPNISNTGSIVMRESSNCKDIYYNETQYKETSSYVQNLGMICKMPVNQSASSFLLVLDNPNIGSQYKAYLTAVGPTGIEVKSPVHYVPGVGE